MLKHLQDMFYDSKTQLIQFTDQQIGTKNVTCTICRPDKKKLKRYWKIGIKLSKNTLQYKQCLFILALRKSNA